MKRWRKFFRLLVDLLLELSDEAAYRRHLERHGSLPSGDQWRRFCEQRLRVKYTRPKCC